VRGCVQTFTTSYLTPFVTSSKKRDRLVKYDCYAPNPDPDNDEFPATLPSYTPCDAAPTCPVGQTGWFSPCDHKSRMLDPVTDDHASLLCAAPSGPTCPPYQTDTLQTLVPGADLYSQLSHESKHPGKNIGKTVFMLAPGAGHTGPFSSFKSPIHSETDSPRACIHPSLQSGFGCLGGGVKDPLKQFAPLDDPDSPGTNSLLSKAICSDATPAKLAKIAVPAGKTLSLHGAWWNSQPSDANLGPVDKGGGDELRLTCKAGPPPSCPDIACP
jgi:hypothetical protein